MYAVSGSGLQSGKPGVEICKGCYMRNWYVAILSLVLFLMWPCGALFGQAGLGSISGSVADPSGALVPGASVRLQ